MSTVSTRLRALTIAAALLFGVALWLVFAYAPREAIMGEVQRLLFW